MIEAAISSSYHIARFFGLRGHTDKTKMITTNRIKDDIASDKDGVVGERAVRANTQRHRFLQSECDRLL
ncbi:hypothetical protein [Bradyrhizobium jicamae]|uniref:hypothetical protein n=1 Tax=Bradyrhizobium jicamae TaxID=280332 RepID=UPI00289FA37C|nr:hypothetical protein [Bradyrhizobium jicamae]